MDAIVQALQLLTVPGKLGIFICILNDEELPIDFGLIKPVTVRSIKPLELFLFVVLTTKVYDITPLIAMLVVVCLLNIIMDTY